MSDPRTRSTENGLGREDVEDVLNPRVAYYRARLAFVESQLQHMTLSAKYGIAVNLGRIEHVRAEIELYHRLIKYEGHDMQEERSYGANIGVLDAKVAKREPGPLEQVQNEQHRTRELIAALQSKVAPVSVPQPQKDQADSAEPPNQLFSILAQQRSINDYLRSVLESIAL